MATLIEFWRPDGLGEALIHSQRVKLLDALAQAATARPVDCVLVTYTDTRNEEEHVLWKKTDYASSCVSREQVDLLNLWKEYV